MKLDSSNPPPYLPQADQESVLRLGLQNCDLHDWIYPPRDLAVFHRHKLALGESPGSHCYAETPGSAQAQAELHDYLLRQLTSDPESGYRREGRRLRQDGQQLSWELGDATLWAASTWVAEDICLLEQSGDDYLLSAASVCSPSNWLLEEKIGRSLDSIHGPVPGYEESLGARANRFLRGLRSERVMLRYNWSIQPGNELCWRDGPEPSSRELPDAEDYWRIERQTFLRLPECGAIVFGIRIFLYSMESLRARRGFDESLRQLLSRLPDSEKRYKGLDG